MTYDYAVGPDAARWNPATGDADDPHAPDPIPPGWSAALVVRHHNNAGLLDRMIVLYSDTGHAAPYAAAADVVRRLADHR